MPGAPAQLKTKDRFYGSFHHVSRMFGKPAKISTCPRAPADRKARCPESVLRGNLCAGDPHHREQTGITPLAAGGPHGY
ncbi:hypothetical protein GCM10011316_13940 [Roseibium aquae]|uniref:Uncharacterized protein n=1 Tax=Roseibium aquae TaxID=1323746 RepID=A0A916WY94_9HYPH|nr:hypothetical protein GCM10011316_13940 [Roseibium aquae]